MTSLKLPGGNTCCDLSDGWRNELDLQHIPEVGNTPDNRVRAVIKFLRLRRVQNPDLFRPDGEGRLVAASFWCVIAVEMETCKSKNSMELA